MSCCQPKKNNSSEDKDKNSCCDSKKSSNPNSGSKTIHPQMTIDEILGLFPYKAQRLSQEITNAGLHCVGCHAATYETLEVGMMTHGKTRQDIDTLVKRLNTLLEEKVDTSTIAITAKAASKFLEILEEDGKQGWGLRFSEEPAGCNGFEYVLDFSEKANADDSIFESCGLQIHVKKVMVAKLLGSVIDFVDGLRGSGFKITNPNVRSSCGCGTSHNY